MDYLARAPGGQNGTIDPHAKHPRTFQCKDALWENLEQIAAELECTVDFLVNDALKHYIRARLTRNGPLEPPSGRVPAPPAPLSGPSRAYPPLGAPPPVPPSFSLHLLTPPPAP